MCRWSYCEGARPLGSGEDYCSPRSLGNTFQPAAVLLSDVPTSLTPQVSQVRARSPVDHAVFGSSDRLAQVLPDSTFVADGYLHTFSKAGFYLIFVGTIFAGISMFIAVLSHHIAFILAAMAAFLSFLALAAGATIWTVIIAKVKHAVDGATVANNTSLGITVNYGNALWLVWGAAGAMILSVVPLLISCCAGRDTE